MSDFKGGLALFMTGCAGIIVWGVWAIATVRDMIG